MKKKMRFIKKVERKERNFIVTIFDNIFLVSYMFLSTIGMVIFLAFNQIASIFFGWLGIYFLSLAIATLFQTKRKVYWEEK